MRIPILTYHGVGVDGNDYASNDHIGLKTDLERLHAEGFRVISLEQIARALILGTLDQLPARALAITFDDGSGFDFFDLEHPAFGPQRSLLNILRDFQQQFGIEAQPGLHATNFAIVSPDARQVLDRTCLIGQGWWGDDWWAPANDEGLMSIANHSWDHRHGTLPESMQFSPGYGQFKELSGIEECDWQVRQAQQYLQDRLGQPPLPIFAYPYGEVAPLLADDYLPQQAQSLGLLAAVTGEPAPVTTDVDCWRIPRYIFRRDWSEPDELLRVLHD